MLTIAHSALLVFMQPALPSTRTPGVAVGVSLALTIPSHPPDEGVDRHE